MVVAVDNDEEAAGVGCSELLKVQEVGAAIAAAAVEAYSASDGWVLVVHLAALVLY